MFANERRGSAGLGSIGAVAAVMVAWVISTGVLYKSFREGGLSRLPANSTCQVVCPGSELKSKG